MKGRAKLKARMKGRAKLKARMKGRAKLKARLGKARELSYELACLAAMRVTPLVLGDTKGGARAATAQMQTRSDHGIPSIADMTLAEKVAQLFIVTPDELTGRYGPTRFDARMTRMLDARMPGGVIVYARSLKTPEQARSMLLGMQEHALRTTGIPLLLGVDEEGGTVARIGRNPAFGVERVPGMLELTSRPGAHELVAQAGDTIGSYLSDLGFNLDFAPVADVSAQDPTTSFLGTRAFGSDPELVSAYALAFARGLGRSDVMPCYKHFPGLGATEHDTHYGIATCDRSLDDILSADLIPFREACRANVPFMMVSHVWMPRLTHDDRPVSLSYQAITELLRKRLGYAGVVVTDGISMESVRRKFPPRRAAIEAICAGCDMVMKPGNYPLVLHSVIDAVKRGEIPEDRIDESVTRILRAKRLWASGDLRDF